LADRTREPAGWWSFTTRLRALFQRDEVPKTSGKEPGWVMPRIAGQMWGGSRWGYVREMDECLRRTWTTCW